MAAGLGLVLLPPALFAQDPAPAPADSAVAAAEDGGFRWTRFELRGRVLARAFSDTADGETTTDGEVENARLELRWRPTRALRAVVEGDAATDVHLKDAYLSLRSSSFELRMGQFKPPLSPIERASRIDLPVSDRGLLGRLLEYSFGVTGRRAGVQGRWNPPGRGWSLTAGAYRASSVRGSRIGDGSFDNPADWDAIKAGARLAWSGRRAEIGAAFDWRPAEPVPGEGYRRFWTSGLDFTWSPGRGGGPALWLEGYAGSSWQDANAFDGEDATFVAGRALGSWRIGGRRGRAVFVEPFLVVSAVDPDTDIRDDLLWETGGGLHAGAFTHLRLVLEVQRREVSRNAPASLGLLPLHASAPDARTRLVAQLGVVF